MRFCLSAEQEMVRQVARDFAQTELLPGVIERDEKQEFPEALVRRMGELGFMGLMVSPEYAGVRGVGRRPGLNSEKRKIPLLR